MKLLLKLEMLILSVSLLILSACQNSPSAFPATASFPTGSPAAAGARLGRIEGSVKDGNNPVPGTTVTFSGKSPNSTADDLSLATDAQGRFNFDYVPAGDYYLGISVEFNGGYQCVDIAHTQVHPGVTAQVNFSLPAALVLDESGHALDAAGNLIECKLKQ